ncbi:hypothetical protein scyTo_0003368 [Scyliorhinus torazame]|uniref:Uncharacterized protein n=1 Tax=Scyliorhinus torazame TaxID=75743 RepID=A0A401PMD7_SCYTO|nr:hypothetical protein [Scyliorhinus torazame]
MSGSWEWRDVTIHERGTWGGAKGGVSAQARLSGRQRIGRGPGDWGIRFVCIGFSDSERERERHRVSSEFVFRDGVRQPEQQCQHIAQVPSVHEKEWQLGSSRCCFFMLSFLCCPKRNVCSAWIFSSEVTLCEVRRTSFLEIFRTSTLSGNNYK